MLKKLIISGFLVIIILVTILFLLFRNGEKSHTPEVSEAVASSAIIFVDKIDYEFLTKEFQSGNLLWKDLLIQNDIAIADSVLWQLNQQIVRMPIFLKQLMNQKLSFSIHLIGKSKLGVVVYVSLDEEKNVQDIDREIKSVLTEDVLLNVRKYEAVELIEASLNKSNHVKGFSYAINDGLLMVSTSSILLEDAIRTLNSKGGIFHQKGFQKVAETAGKYVQGNMYVNYGILDQLFYPALNTNGSSVISSLKDLANWGEFDVDFSEDIIMLNGMTYTEDSLKGWFNVFKGQDPVRLEAAAYIPSNVIDFLSVGISDPDLFYEALKAELLLRKQLADFQKYEKSYTDRLGRSPIRDILDLLNNEIVRFHMELGSKSESAEVVLIEVKSGSETINSLERWISILAENKGKNLNNYMDSYVLDKQTSYSLYDLPETLYEGSVLGNFFKSSFAVYENYIIFSDSHEAISRTIYQNILHKTLANEDSYQNVNNLISTRSNLTYYMHPSLFIENHKTLFGRHFLSKLEKLSSAINKISGLIVQYSNEDEMLYSNTSLKYTSTIKEKAMTVWESLLDSMAITKPELVINHNTSEKEIFLQEATNSVCLLNSTGRILWRAKTDGPILSEIYQIDYYKNGKLQYLFSTKKGIHLLDRNGNYVERYPIKFRSDATNGIVLFDYDNRKEYRLFVACEDRKVYAYDIEGNLVPGWDFGKSESEVSKPIQHFRIIDKDFIVFSDRIRTYILDRRGQERVQISDQMAISHNNSFYLDMNVIEDRPRFVSTDTSGSVISIDLNGKMEIVLEHEAGPKHFFRSKDLDQDGTKEFIFADENTLEVLDIKGKRLFSFKIKNDISTLPDIYEFSSADLKIGIGDAEKNLIYLINSDGTLYEGFPLEGNTRFSIGYFAGSDSRFNLIVGSKNGFLYNYSIE